MVERGRGMSELVMGGAGRARAGEGGSTVHTFSRCRPTWISAPRAGRGSNDQLQPVWSCLGLTCGNGDLAEAEMGS